MYQNFNYYPQQTQAQQPSYQQTMMPNNNYMRPVAQSGLRGRPVSSIEEARASSIDFDGSIFYFPDLANKRIYTKQINLDGTATLNMYEIKEIPAPQSTTQVSNYITRDEFEATIASIKETINPPQPIPEAARPQPKSEVLKF